MILLFILLMVHCLSVIDHVFDAGKSEQYIDLDNVRDAVGETLVLIFETAVDTRLEMFVFFPVSLVYKTRLYYSKKRFMGQSLKILPPNGASL